MSSPESHSHESPSTSTPVLSTSGISLHASACGCFQCRLSEPLSCIVCGDIFDWDSVSDYDIENDLEELCQKCKIEKQKIIRKIKKKQTELAKRLKKPTGRPPRH